VDPAPMSAQGKGGVTLPEPPPARQAQKAGRSQATPGMRTTVDLDALDGTALLDLKPNIPAAVNSEWRIRSRPPAD
jgi:hypothetical protein